ncbi:hypothetical protein LRR18_04450 [Mangrovimonas sp. AS39]|uniref:hypothetical protein n=1 Tax=Mangrovimonas TaxID=1211036 RepID=UPI0006B3FA13|nr:MULTISPECIES: hypothetical protein [Mangrovimonas]MCF1190827.1 hypothetical protein [Mangrovimonas futianensis]MCF1194524.1 hypothetical protein [Mangrovimonas futianensis]
MTKKNQENQITRKEAIKRMGKYAALTAAGTFLILNPAKAQVGSPPDPGGGFERNGQGDFEDMFEG